MFHFAWHCMLSTYRNHLLNMRKRVFFFLQHFLTIHCREILWNKKRERRQGEDRSPIFCIIPRTAAIFLIWRRHDISEQFLSIFWIKRTESKTLIPEPSFRQRNIFFKDKIVQGFQPFQFKERLLQLKIFKNELNIVTVTLSQQR